MNDGKGSFRCLLRNLRKMHEAKAAKPQTVSRKVADRLAGALELCEEFIADSEGNAGTTITAGIAARKALAAYRKAVSS